MSAPKILQVCNTDFYLTKFLTPLVRALVAEGFHVECLCEGGERVDASTLGPNVVVHSFEFPKAGSPMEFARAVSRMSDFLRDRPFDCVNGHNRNASIVARIAAWLRGTPVNLYTAHGFYFHDDQPTVAREATIALEAALARITDHTLSQSTEDMELMIRRGFIDADAITRIGNGIDTERFRPRTDREAVERQLGLPSGHFRVGATGRLVVGKGFIDLLDAFTVLHAHAPKTQLLIIGGNIDQDISPFAEEFKRAVADRGLNEAVVVTGITHEVEKYLGTTDVFVLPSYREGLPRALLEAMSMEIPALATEIRGCREVVIEGENGHLFQPHDVQRLAELLERLHRLPEEERRALGKNARRRIVERYDERAYVAIQVKMIRELLAAAAARAPKKRRPPLGGFPAASLELLRTMSRVSGLSG